MWIVERKPSTILPKQRAPRRMGPGVRRDDVVGDTRVSTKYDSAFSRHEAPEVLQLRHPPNTEGAGNAGCLLHPRSRVQTVRKETHTSIQVQAEHSDVPCAMALRLMPGSPWRRIPLASIAGELAALAARSGFANLHRLDTSHGCRDHTVLPYASTPFVWHAVPAHG
jgi:hypothetical protein